MNKLMLSLLGAAALAAAHPSSARASAPMEAAHAGVVLPAQESAADSLYRSARRALNDNDYRVATQRFRALRERFPRSTYVADAHYWEAFSLSRLGGSEDLKTALALLDRQLDQYADARTNRDARELRARIRGQLAQRGDAEAAEQIATSAAALAPPPPPPPPSPSPRPAAAPRPRATPTPPRPASAPRARARYQSDDCDDEDDERLVALNALIQMRSEQAVPILERVLERRDEGSVCLRRKAVFLMSQKRSPETARILLQVARTDPDQEVREQAVFWLSQVNTAEATAALDSILQHATDRELQEKAIFALSQQRSEAAGRALRDHLERNTTPDDLKENIIFWLGQRRSEDNAQYLRDYYGRTNNATLKEKIIFSLSQMNLEENARWIMAIALDEAQPVDVRKNALFWAGQMRAVNVGDLVALYGQVTDREIKEHLIFVYSQRRESAAVDQLMEIARNETDRELRGKAIFWLGQSRDPRAAEFLLEIINR